MITNETSDSPFASFGELLADAIEELRRMSESKTHLPGLSTGFSAIDHATLGLKKSDLIVLASRPSMGKTSLALNIALNVAQSARKAVAIFPLSMSQEQLVTRLLSMEALVDNVRLQTGQVDESDWERVAEAVTALFHMDILINDSPKLTVEDISAKCKSIDNLGLVVIDDLQFITSPDGRASADESRYEVVSAIFRRLKIMARELNVPVLCLSQVNRNCETRGDKRPLLFDMRDSGVIEEYADIVMFLYRDNYYWPDTEELDIAECIFAKNRYGEIGKVKLLWLPEYTRFATIEDT